MTMPGETTVRGVAGARRALRHPGAGGQLARFVIVGVGNTALTLIAYAIAIRAGVRYLPAGAGAYALGGVNGFVWNRRWTFAHQGPILPAAARYCAIAAVGIVANLLLLHEVVGAGVPRDAAEIVAVAPVTLVTFALNRAWAFAVTDAASSSPALVPDRARRRVRRGARARGADPAAASDRSG
jgi:putative flippase GtrA